jgi:hypothetical protein
MATKKKKQQRFLEAFEAALKANADTSQWVEYTLGILAENCPIAFIPNRAAGQNLDSILNSLTLCLFGDPHYYGQGWQGVLDSVMARVNGQIRYALQSELDESNQVYWPDLAPLEIGSKTEIALIEVYGSRLVGSAIHLEGLSHSAPNLERLKVLALETASGLVLDCLKMGAIALEPINGMKPEIAKAIRANPSWPKIQRWKASQAEVQLLCEYFGNCKAVDSSRSSLDKSQALEVKEFSTLAELAVAWTEAAWGLSGALKHPIVNADRELIAAWRANELELADRFSANKSLAASDLSLALCALIDANQAKEFFNDRGFSINVIESPKANVISEASAKEVGKTSSVRFQHQARLLAIVKALGLNPLALPPHRIGVRTGGQERR